MEARQLDKLIAIQQLTKTPDEGGGNTQAWTTFAQVWAQKNHQATREFYAAQKINAETTDLFTCRHLTGVKTSMRVFWNNQIFEIIGAPADKRKNELVLYCKEVI